MVCYSSFEYILILLLLEALVHPWQHAIGKFILVKKITEFAILFHELVPGAILNKLRKKDECVSKVIRKLNSVGF